MTALRSHSSTTARQGGAPARLSRRAGPAALALAALVPATALRGQMPGAPVLQNAFANGGVTVAVNHGSSKDLSLLGGALAWAPGTGRFQMSAGLGRATPDRGDAQFAWGARLGVPLFSFAGGRAGLAPFVGIGGAGRDSVKTLLVPAGVGAGWRFALGSTRALSVYATGTYLWAREEFGAESVSGSLFRVAAAADVTVFRNVGLTLGYEGGGEAGTGEAGPRGPIFGAGLSWAFR